jgi:Fur family ferric uptake transcriptional regulator
MTANRTRRGPHETRQRQAVPHALAQAPGYLSAQAPHAHLRQTGETIALTTVHRALHILADAGHIGSTHDAAGERLFHLRVSPGRGHYLVCRDCDGSVSIDTDTR